MNYNTIISAGKLNDIIGDEQVRVFDCRFSLKDPQGGLKCYQQGHLPHAQFADMDTQLSSPMTASSGRHPLPSPEDFIKQLRAWGVSNDTQVIAYDDMKGAFAARLWWMMRWLGHEKVAVLDGGLPKWLSRGFSTSSQYKSTTTNGDFVADDSERLFIHFDSINAYSKSLDHLIIDARSAKRFNGEVPEPRQGLRSGTLPNSINIPYTELLNNGCFKSKTALLDIFESKIDMQNTLVFSCGSGITACNLALGASIAGYHNLLVYDGSWTEYGSLTKS